MIKLRKVTEPILDNNLEPVMLSDETMVYRKTRVLSRMLQEGLDAVVIYADVEHGHNFAYLTGFLPRFEEALLILYSNGNAEMILGNENLNKAQYSRIKVDAIHLPHLSLPNQPMESSCSIVEILKTTKLDKTNTIGIVGWKNFTSKYDNNETLFDIPYFLMESIKALFPDKEIVNATRLFIGNNGARIQNNANEIAHYEFGAALAGNCIMNTMNKIEEGISEIELASSLSMYGQTHNVVTIMSTGKRFEYANLYPTSKKVKVKDKISMTTGYKGGLQSRNGYAICNEQQLPIAESDYLERMAIPYFNAIKIWLESISIGMSGDEMYQVIEGVLPKSEYGWTLNPGHLCADEEWLSSPIYHRSSEIIQSGMLFQVDIIPSVSGYAGASCESGIVIADEVLRNEIKDQYPLMWERIRKRREYIINELGIHISEEILPTSCATAYFRPFLLNKEMALNSVVED